MQASIRKWLIAFVASFVFNFIKAQDVRWIRVTLGGGKSSTSNSLIAYFEPSFLLNDKIRIGFRQELFGIPKSRIGISTSVNAQYYFKRMKGVFLQHFRNRFFFGLGLSGNLRGVTINPYYIAIGSKSYNVNPVVTNGQFFMGLFPRIGFEKDHLSFMIEYNFIQRQKIFLEYDDPYTGNIVFSKPFYNNNNYLGLKVGVIIGRIRRR